MMYSKQFDPIVLRIARFSVTYISFQLYDVLGSTEWRTWNKSDQIVVNIQSKKNIIKFL